MSKKSNKASMNPQQESVPPTTVDSNQIDLESQVTYYQEQWKRARADYQNLEKRIENHQANINRFATVNLLKQIIEVLDDLHRAQQHLQDQGLSLVIKSLEDILAGEGLKEINTHDQPFDVQAMECVDLTDGAKDQVINTIQKGYRLNDIVLRAAKVMVGRGE